MILIPESLLVQFLAPDDERLAILTPFKTMEDAMKAKEVVQKYIDAMHE